MDIFSQMQQLLQMLLDTAAIGAGMAVGVLAGYAIFKLLTLAGYMYFARFVVVKIYDLIKINMQRAVTYNIVISDEIVMVSEINMAKVRSAMLVVASKHSHNKMYGTEVDKFVEYLNAYDPKK